MSKELIIYHANCNDGFGAAWAAWNRFGYGPEYHAATYGQEPPPVFDRNVYVLDFCYDRATMERFAKEALSLTVLDHHKTAAKDMAGFEEGLGPIRRKKIHVLFDLHHSGAMLAWMHFFPTIRPPRMIELVEDRDIWQFRYGDDTDAMHLYLQAVGMDFDSWTEAGRNTDEALDHGRTLMKLERARNAITMRDATVWANLQGHDIPMCNAPPWMSSEVGNELCKKHRDTEFAATWWVRSDAMVVVSLRSAGFDVSAVAREFGGGGHERAAGFAMDWDRWVELFPMCRP